MVEARQQMKNALNDHDGASRRSAPILRASRVHRHRNSTHCTACGAGRARHRWRVQLPLHSPARRGGERWRKTCA